MIGTIIGAAIFISLPVLWYINTPKEDPETVAAREFYGKVKD